MYLFVVACKWAIYAVWSGLVFLNRYNTYKGRNIKKNKTKWRKCLLFSSLLYLCRMFYDNFELGVGGWRRFLNRCELIWGHLIILPLIKGMSSEFRSFELLRTNKASYKMPWSLANLAKNSWWATISATIIYPKEELLYLVGQTG